MGYGYLYSHESMGMIFIYHGYTYGTYRVDFMLNVGINIAYMDSMGMTPNPKQLHEKHHRSFSVKGGVFTSRCSE